MLPILNEFQHEGINNLYFGEEVNKLLVVFNKYFVLKLMDECFEKAH